MAHRTNRANPILAAALLAVASGCDEVKSPVEPVAARFTPGPTAVPPKTWTGTFSGVSITCTSSARVTFDAAGALPAQADTACLNAGASIFFSLTRSGNALAGYALWGDPEFYPVTGTLTESAMDVTIFNDTVDFPTGPTGPLGTMRLHP